MNTIRTSLPFLLKEFIQINVVQQVLNTLIRQSNMASIGFAHAHSNQGCHANFKNRRITDSSGSNGFRILTDMCLHRASYCNRLKFYEQNCLLLIINCFEMRQIHHQLIKRGTSDTHLCGNLIASATTLADTCTWTVGKLVVDLSHFKAINN